MAKVFAGFTPEQLGKIVPEMQGMQGDEQAKFLAANPAAASRVGKMAEVAKRRIGMAYGGVVRKGFQEGGTTSDVSTDPITDTSADQAKLDAAQRKLADAQAALQQAIADQQANPEDASKAEAVGKAQAAVNNAQQNLSSAQAQFSVTAVPTAAETTSALMTDPSKVVTTADVATVSDEEKQAGMIDTTTGQLTTPAPTATVTTAETDADVVAPEAKAAVTYEPLPATADVKDVMSRLSAATGKPSDEALSDAATMKPEELAQLGLSAAQIEEAQRVEQVAPRVLEEGELISGAAVDMERVKKETNFEAATGSPSTDATVQGQLTGLMEQFEGKEPPAWAAGAMRAAAARMAQRGLSASSMAGQAIVQAAMESAIPIAQQDAATVAKFEMQNLSNRQQAAMFAAEQRANFLNLEFNQEFQSRVANAAKISDIADMNFTAEQQVALENARLAQSVDLANLNAANAKVLADAAALTQIDTANLNNRQQAAQQRANAFLQVDMQNLDNEQQTAMFKAQQVTNALLSDAAAENAARQFNATSENQTNQFFANLDAQIAQFNTAQTNEMNRFNAGEANALSKFNAAALAAREQFNAQNALVVAQANTAWAQKITTTDNAAQNQANRDAALSANNFTMTAYNNTLQLERDVISYAWRSAESQMDRDNAIRLQMMANEMKEEEIQASIDKSRGSGFGTIMNTVVSAVLNKWLG